MHKQTSVVAMSSSYIPFFSSCWEKWAVRSNTRVFVQKLVYCRGEKWWPVGPERQVWWQRIGMHQNGPMGQRKISKGEPTSLRMEGSYCGSIMFSLPSGKTQKLGQQPEMLITILASVLSCAVRGPAAKAAVINKEQPVRASLQTSEV